MGAIDRYSTKGASNREAERRGIKRTLKARVLEVLTQQGALTRDDIAEKGDMRLASVCAATNDLIAKGVLRVKDTVRSADTGMRRERLEVVGAG